MASTYTTNTGLEKIATGEKSGTWGDITNTNFDIIDRALNGVVSLSITGSSSTLTTNDGSLSDGQNKVLVLTGSPGVEHTITVSPNDTEKLYFVVNNTDSRVNFNQGSGADGFVDAGQSGIIYCDGAGSGAATVNIAQTFGMNDTSITGGDANFTTLNVSSVPVATTTGTQTLTNKTLTSPTINSASITGSTLGSSTATTQTDNDNSTKVATTAYVDTRVSNATGSLGTMSSQAANNVSITGGAISGVTLAGTGGSITALNGSNISTGTVAGARLPYATSSVRGTVRVSVSGSTVNIYTSD